LVSGQLLKSWEKTEGKRPNIKKTLNFERGLSRGLANPGLCSSPKFKRKLHHKVTDFSITYIRGSTILSSSTRTNLTPKKKKFPRNLPTKKFWWKTKHCTVNINLCLCLYFKHTYVSQSIIFIARYLSYEQKKYIGKSTLILNKYESQK
jgi:hypothetical protein